MLWVHIGFGTLLSISSLQILTCSSDTQDPSAQGARRAGFLIQVDVFRIQLGRQLKERSDMGSCVSLQMALDSAVPASCYAKF